MDTFERKVLRRMFVGIKRKLDKRCNKEFMQLFGDLDILSFVRISRLNSIGHVNRMVSKRKVSQLFSNNPLGSPLRRQPKTDSETVYKQTLIDAKL
jgi:hypothetical protein